MDLIEGLNYMGLNNKQAKVYTSLLQTGEATAYAVAELSGLKRPTVYVVLDELRRKGLVLKIPHAKKQLFSAKSPEEFFTEAENRLNRARRMLPQLLALTKNEDKPKTYLFEGLEGYKEALFMKVDEMAGKEIVGFYSRGSDNTGKVVGITEKYFKRLEHQNTKVRGLIPSHESIESYVGKYPNIDFKKVPMSSYSSQDAVEIGDGYVKIYSKDLQTVVIESKSIAETFRQIFEMTWSSTITTP